MVRVTIHTTNRTISGSAKSWRSAVRNAYLTHHINPADIVAIEEV